ncbi:hypothetical protein [Cupriavidus campinensis]|uniref:hypothetical protein n=1 Tax=Cupriavidus campinensis TaxID=151783 RepID=UPI00164315EC|nr:hypothetical protein [Cupriavidus campinensis]
MIGNPFVFLVIILGLAVVVAIGFDKLIAFFADKLGVADDDDDLPPTGAAGVAA